MKKVALVRVLKTITVIMLCLTMTISVSTELLAFDIEETEKEDLNNGGTVNVGDVAIVAYYYNATSSDSNWDAANIADVNGDGVVDVLDLASVATKAME